jgi:hypothetical protein
MSSAPSAEGLHAVGVEILEKTGVLCVEGICWEDFTPVTGELPPRGGSYKVTGMPVGQTSKFELLLDWGNGEFTISNIVEVVALPAPQSVASFSATVNADGVASLSWQETDAANTVGYYIYRNYHGPDFSPRDEIFVADVPVGNTSWIDPWAGPNDMIWYHIVPHGPNLRPDCATGGVSTVVTPPLAPAAATASVVRDGENGVRLTWEDESWGSWSFNIYRQKNGGPRELVASPLSSTGRGQLASYVDYPVLDGDADYTYSISTYSGVAESQPSAPATVHIASASNVLPVDFSYTLAGAAGSSRVFRLSRWEGASRLTFSLAAESGSYGAATLRVRAGSPPTATDYDCATDTSAPCDFTYVVPGDYYVQVDGVTDYSGLRLRGQQNLMQSYFFWGPPGMWSQPMGGAPGSYTLLTFAAATDTIVDVWLEAEQWGWGNADLYANCGSAPVVDDAGNVSNFASASTGPGLSEHAMVYSGNNDTCYAVVTAVSNYDSAIVNAVPQSH